MSDDVFDGQALSDKLFKLNSSQQSIESLSRSCISQRKRAKQIVEIWHKSFKSAQREQLVSFLYLANDILQNSRRKGSEFVNEFWKVMPSALKHVSEHGDENGKKVASRLVGIWDERRVFGSRVQNLKDEMLGKSPVPQLASNGKTSNSNPIKIVKRDANSLRLKLAVGDTPEKIMTAFHLVHDENATEDTALNNCEGAVRRFGDLEREIETQGVVQGSSLLDEIQEQENVLQECVNQLETAEKTRTSLISQLKVALQDQESKLDVIHNQLQVARRQIDHAVTLRKKLVSPSVPGEVTNVVDNLPQSMSFGSATHVTEEENKKAAAAAVAAKLAASTSSAQMLTSVLSSLVAEEAASISNSFNSAGFTSAGLSLFPPEKRPKLEKPMSVPESTNSDAVSSGYFTSTQTQYLPPPPLPPPPAIGGTNSPANQFVQSSGLVMGGMPYAYAASSLPPPPPPGAPHMAMGLMRPAHQPPQQQQQQQQQSQPPQTTGGGYYRPPGIGFYGQSHQQTPPPVPRQ